MKINQIVQETTTAGSIGPGAQHGIVKMQTRNPSVYGSTKAGNLLKGKKTNKPFANSVNESAELSEADLQEDDIIVLPGQGRKLKTGFVPHGKSRVDHEVEMARSDVLATMKNARAIYDLLKNKSEEEGLEGWVQEKLIKANDYLNSVKEYYDEKMMQQESVPPAGVIGNGAMGEGKDDVDSLVTDTEAVMKKFQIDAEQALKIVLGDREYNSRRSFYSFYIRQIIARSKQQGMVEGSASGRFQMYGVRWNSKKRVSFGSFPTLDAAMVKADDLDTAGFDPMDPREDHDELHLLDTQTGQQFIHTDDGVNQEWEPIRGKKGVVEGYDSVESDYGQWEDILHRGNPSGAYAFNLMRGDETTIRNILAYVKQNRAVLGKEVSPETGRTVKDAIMDIRKEFPQLYQAAQQPQGMAEGHTEVKDKQGKVVSWRNDTEWHKAEKNKQGQPKDPRGIVTHLSDVARRKTEKQDTKEGKIDFAKKLGKNIDKSNKAVVKTNKEIGSRVADIGAGGKEYNVKTDKAWDDAQKAKKAK
jgi:hypothetical protein